MQNPAKFLVNAAYNSLNELRKKRLSIAGFQHWKKSYWKTRCIVYCLIGAASAYNLSGVQPGSIKNLVRYACIGIESAKIQPYKIAELYKIREAKKMQENITEYFDKNKNDILDNNEANDITLATPLSLIDMQKPSKANLEALVETSKKLGLSIKELTAGQIRRDALVFALKEDKKAHDEMWSEVEPNLQLKYAKPKDYLKLITWERGAWHFFSMMQGVAYFPPDKSVNLISGEEFQEQDFPRIINFYPMADENGYKNKLEEHKTKIVESMHAKDLESKNPSGF